GLAPLVTTPVVVTLLDCVDTALELATLCGPGLPALASLMTAGVPAASLKLWCRAPVLTSTAQLLGHVALATCIPILPLLAGDNVGPIELMTTFTAGANVVDVTQALSGAKSVLKTPAQTLQYFQLNPAHTAVQFRAAAARAASTSASVAPSNLGLKYTPT